MTQRRVDERKTQAERQAIRHVMERLSKQFPELSTEEVEQAVHGKYQTFADSTVRDFVPVLVEKATRRGLAERSSRGS
jgi:hypothetical protein